jgi:23S rRNA (guanosine2251-2'-O)-methyltransferase
VSSRPRPRPGRDRRPGPSRPSRPGPETKRGLGGEQVEGRHAVRELLLAGRRRTHEVLVAADVDGGPAIEDIVALAAELRVPVRSVGRGKFTAMARTEAPQGVIARAAPLPEADLDELSAAGPTRRPPFLVAVDGVTDPGNLGALLRGAECAGVTGVVLPRHRAVHITPTVAKAAAGAIEYLPMAVVAGLPAALARLKELGVWVVGLDPGGADPLDRLPVATSPIALVLGAEGKGLSRLVRDRCDLVVSIPVRGRLGSLNVAAAAAIGCYEVARQRATPDKPD